MTAKRRKRSAYSNWVGFAPFLVFCLAFAIVPIFFLLKGSIVERATGQLTLAHYQALQIPLYINSFVKSAELSGLTAVVGVIFGAPIGYAIDRSSSGPLQDAHISLSHVITNFAGATPAFAFVVILGLNRVLIQLLLQDLHFDLYQNFSIYSFSGLVLAYVYFQLPLMVLPILPAFAGIKKEWQESAQSLSANTLQFWQSFPLLLLRSHLPHVLLAHDLKRSPCCWWSTTLSLDNWLRSLL